MKPTLRLEMKEKSVRNLRTFTVFLSYSLIKAIEYVCLGIDSGNHLTTIWALLRENLSLLQMNNKSADQPAHQYGLVSAFVISCMQNIIFKLASYIISSF